MALAVIVYLVVLASLVLPRATAGLLPLLAIAAIVLVRPSLADLWQAVTGSLAAKVLLLFALYALINATWSLDRGEALAKVGLAIAYLLLVLAALGAVAQTSAGDGRRLALALVLGAAAGAFLLAFEVFSEQMLAKALYDLSNSVGREPDIEDLNRNAGLLSLLTWPVLLAASGLDTAKLRYGLGGGFLVLAVAAVANSAHETSMVALAASALVFVLCLWRPRLGRWAVIALWIAAFALVLPTVSLAYKAELHLAHWLPNSARARVVLWHETASRVPEAPILGVGVRSTRLLDAQNKAKAELPPDFPFPLHTGRHAHNFFLQTWYELGLVGVILFAAAGLAVLWRLPGLPSRAQPFAYAQFVAFTAVAATAWGMWQSWLLAGVGLSVIHAAIAVRAERSSGGETAG